MVGKGRKGGREGVNKKGGGEGEGGGGGGGERRKGDGWMDG